MAAKTNTRNHGSELQLAGYLFRIRKKFMPLKICRTDLPMDVVDFLFLGFFKRPPSCMV